jgi:hypothetical protein
MGETILEELQPTRQIPGEPHRRWFNSDDMDLIVWFRADGTPLSFQLCYDKRGYERAITWKPDRGFRHEAVDNGERTGASHKGTPLLVADGAFDPAFVSRLFADASSGLPEPIAAFVADAIRTHPSYVQQD